MTTRIYKDESKRACVKAIEGLRWNVSSRGWPDFFCWDGDAVMVVKVMADNRKMSPSQKRILKALQDRACSVKIWTPSKGFTTLSAW